MTDRNALTPFERRVADQMERYVDGAIDPKPASEIADAAMRPTSLWSRARHAPRSRHLLLFGLAAALLVPVAAVGGLARLFPTPTTNDLVRPSDDASIVQPTRKVATTSGYTAIYVRRSAGDVPSVDVVAVRPGGDELLLRTLPDPIQGHRLVLGLGGSRLGVRLARARCRQRRQRPILVDPRGPARPGIATVGRRRGDGRHRTVVGPDRPPRRDDGRFRPRRRRSGRPYDASSRLAGHPAQPRRGVHHLDRGRARIHRLEQHGRLCDDPARRERTGARCRPRSERTSAEAGGQFGPDMATLQVCADGMGVECSGGNDGRVELVDTNGTQTIWRPVGGDHALAADFATGGGYWLTLDHGHGTQVVLTRIGGTAPDLTATVDRAADWRSVGVMGEFPDHSAVVAYFERSRG